MRVGVRFTEPPQIPSIHEAMLSIIDMDINIIMVIMSC